jgi:hypothetical protein
MQRCNASKIWGTIMADMPDDIIKQLRTSLSDLADRLDSTTKTNRLELDTFRKLLQEQLAAKDLRVDALKNETKSLRAHNEDLYRQNIETLKDMNAAFEKHDASFTSQSEAVNRQHMDMLKGLSASFERHNDALQRQIGFRFNFVTSMLGFVVAFVGLVLAGIFIYNKQETEKLDRAEANLNQGKQDLERGLKQGKEGLEQGMKALQQQTNVLTDNAAAFSEVLSKLAQADGLISDGHREYQNNAYIDAHYFAREAIELLEPVFNKTGITAGQLRSYRLDAATCKTVAPSPAPAGANTSGVINPEALRTAVTASLVEAYDLLNRARLFLADSKDLQVSYGSYEDIRRDGEFLITLNDSRWEGYHWVGVAAVHGNSFQLGAACYDRSIAQKRTSNKDSLNLTELLFLQGQFPEARTQAAIYLKGVGSAIDRRGLKEPASSFVSAIEAVAHFYLTTSNYLSPEPQDSVLSLEEYRKQLNDSANVKLGGTFSDTELKKYLEGRDFADQVKDGTKVNAVRSTMKCLLERSDCNEKGQKVLSTEAPLPKDH